MLYRFFVFIALFFIATCVGTPHTGQKNTPQTPRKAVNGSSVTASAPAPVKAVKVGLLVPLSGEASEVGTALLDAATLALMDKYTFTDAENAHVKIVLVPKDTAGNPQQAAKAVDEAIKAGARIILGPLFAPEVKAVASIADNARVNVLTFSNNPQVAAPNVFVFGFRAEEQVARIINYSLNHNINRLALLTPNSPYGKTVEGEALAILQRSGLAAVATQSYAPTADMAPVLDALAASYRQKPFSSLLLAEGGNKLSGMVEGLRTRGIPASVRLMGTGLWDDPFVLQSSSLVGGWFASSPPERFVAFDRRFRDTFGYAPPRVSSLAYDAMALAASLGLSPNGANFSADAVTDPAGFNGPVNGIFRCRTNGLCDRGLAVLEITGGNPRMIDPAPLAF